MSPRRQQRQLRCWAVGVDLPLALKSHIQQERWMRPDINHREQPMLRVGVVAGIMLAIGGLVDSFTDFWWMPFAFLIAGLCGAFCGGVATFTAEGFQRVIAALSAAVSLYALLRLIRFLGWAVNLP